MEREMARRFFTRGATLCVAALVSAGVSVPLYAEDRNSSAPIDGWGDYRFGMTPEQAEEVLHRTGGSYTIEGTVWNVKLYFGLEEYKQTGEATTTGPLYEIKLSPGLELRPCYPSLLLKRLEDRYGAFQVYPGSGRELPGRRPQSQPYAVKQIGSVTITLDFQSISPQVNGSLLCNSTTITYFKAGVAKVPESSPRGQF
jgi:hypothetical protein